VKLKISVAEDGTGNGQVRLRVRFEGDGEPREATSELSPGSWYLEAPSSRDGPVTKVTLSRVIPSDGSHPAIRIKQITWRDTLALHHLGLQEQMTFHRMEDLKRLAATPSPPAPPSALKRWFSDWKRKP
jgi:hypothetical protein